MKNKTISIIGFIRAAFIALLLLFIIIKNESVISKIFILPFLFCSLAVAGKNICLIISKPKYASIFDKLFLLGFFLFWFGFLIFWCYLNLTQKNYLLLLFFLPFWICGIYAIRKFFFKNITDKTNKKQTSNFSFQIVISVFLVGVILISGIVMLFFGIRDSYLLHKRTENYATIDGYFSDYKIYDSGSKEKATYKLIYIYLVNDKTYAISTDYVANYIPTINSVREIKYNPENPEEAVLSGTNREKFLIFLGIFFILGSFTFILGALSLHGCFDKFKFDIMGIYIGFVLLLVGIGIIWFQNGTTFSFMETIKSFGLWILIPLVFIVIGLFQIVKCFLISFKNVQRSRE